MSFGEALEIQIAIDIVKRLASQSAQHGLYCEYKKKKIAVERLMIHSRYRKF
jgi:hypothetical protein